MTGLLRAALAISRRELLEGLRDPSVFFSTIVMPTLFGPLMLWGSLQVMMLVEGDLEQAPPTAVILVERGGVAGAPGAVIAGEALSEPEREAEASVSAALRRPIAAAPRPGPGPSPAPSAEGLRAADAEEEAEDGGDEGEDNENTLQERKEDKQGHQELDSGPRGDADGQGAAPPEAPPEAPGSGVQPAPAAEAEAAPSPPGFTVITLEEALARAAEAGRPPPPPAPRDALISLINAGIVDLGLVLRVDPPRWAVELLSIQTWSRSAVARERASKALLRLERRRKAGLLRSWGIDPAKMRSFRSEELNTAEASSVIGHLLGLILPMVVMLNIIGGATAPCVEAIAGERERGTLETTLVSGAPRSAVLAGKALTIMTWTVFTAAGSLFGLGLSVMHALASFGGRLSGELRIEADQAALGGLVLLSVLPVAPLLNLVATLPARTTRQAQTVAGFLVMPLMGLCFLSLDDSRTLDGMSALVPFLNAILAGREALSGTLLPLSAFTAAGLNLALTLALAGVCAWGFRGERLVLGLATRWPRMPWKARDRSSP